MYIKTDNLVDPEIINFSIQEHIDFINSLPSKPMCETKKIRTDEALISFTSFQKYYPNLSSDWKELIHRCYDPTHIMYPYFGGRGIGMDLDFRNAKTFCCWCISQGHFRLKISNILFFQRIDKNKNYSTSNCYFVKASDFYTNSMSLTLLELRLRSAYDKYKNPDVTYFLAKSRFLNKDMNILDSVSLPLGKIRETKSFSPSQFWDTYATPSSISKKAFKYRWLRAHEWGYDFDPMKALDPKFRFENEDMSEESNLKNHKNKDKS